MGTRASPQKYPQRLQLQVQVDRKWFLSIHLFLLLRPSGWVRLWQLLNATSQTGPLRAQQEVSSPILTKIVNRIPMSHRVLHRQVPVLSQVHQNIKDSMQTVQINRSQNTSSITTLVQFTRFSRSSIRHIQWEEHLHHERLQTNQRRTRKINSNLSELWLLQFNQKISKTVPKHSCQ